MADGSRTSASSLNDHFAGPVIRSAEFLKLGLPPSNSEKFYAARMAGLIGKMLKFTREPDVSIRQGSECSIET